MEVDDSHTFYDLGLCEEMTDACKSLNWKYPTPIQVQTIPVAIQKKDVCGTAPTGSGKTGAYMLPIFHHMLENPHQFFALVLAPTRELCTQINQVTRDIGKEIGVRVCTVIGGVSETEQVKALREKPHVIVATPGRLAKILRSFPGVIALDQVECLVFDEADNMLYEKSFQNDLQLILDKTNKQRQTFLFSATMPEEIEQLAKKTLSDPVRISLTTHNAVAKTLSEYVCLAKTDQKEATLYTLLNEYKGQSTIVFVSSVKTAFIMQKMLSNLRIKTTVYHGKLPQRERQQAVDSFKEGRYQVLVATNVGSRGLDVPRVDLIINYEMPAEFEDYIHRVGRAGRAERIGTAITLITANELPDYLRLERFLKKKLEKHNVDLSKVDACAEEVMLAKKIANDNYKDFKKKQSQKRKERMLDKE